MQKYACPPAQLESLPTSHNLLKKSEVAANPKMGLFSSEGHLQICFRRIMHRGQKLEVRLKHLNFELGTSRRAVDWLFSLWVKNEHERENSQNRTEQNLIRIEISLT